MRKAPNTFHNNYIIHELFLFTTRIFSIIFVRFYQFNSTIFGSAYTQVAKEQLLITEQTLSSETKKNRHTYTVWRFH